MILIAPLIHNWFVCTDNFNVQKTLNRVLCNISVCLQNCRFAITVKIFIIKWKNQLENWKIMNLNLNLK